MRPEDTPIGPVPRSRVAAANHRRSRAGLIGFALVGGIAIFVGGTPYFEYTVANDSPVYNAILVAVFGLLALYMRRRDGLESYAICSHALFVAATAMLIMVVGPFNWLVTAEDESVLRAVQDKLAQFLAVVPAILVLTWAAHRPWGAIYLEKGRPKRWLTFGLSWFVVSAIVVTVLALASGIDPGTLLSAGPWILVFAALNSVMEELWFRGIFLRPYAAGMGGAQAVVVTAIIFGVAHIGATYVSSVAVHLFLAFIAVSIGVVAAWAMRWANALWGSVLFHIALDLLVVFGLLESV